MPSSEYGWFDKLITFAKEEVKIILIFFVSSAVIAFIFPYVGSVEKIGGVPLIVLWTAIVLCVFSGSSLFVNAVWVFKEKLEAFFDERAKNKMYSTNVKRIKLALNHFETVKDSQKNREYRKLIDWAYATLPLLKFDNYLKSEFLREIKSLERFVFKQDRRMIDYVLKVMLDMLQNKYSELTQGGFKK